MQENRIQNTIKNKIIMGFGFIRCLRNIVYLKIVKFAAVNKNKNYE